MDLIDFVKSSENIVFFISISTMLVFALIEVISLILGVSVSEALDNLIPDLGVDVDLDVDVDAEIGSSFNVFSWLGFGKVPFLVLVILFLTIYGLTGFILQGIFINVFGFLIPGVFASIIVLIPTFIMQKFLSEIISKIIPQVETTAVKINSLQGKIAEIGIGTASFDNPAEAKVKDKHGKTHYVRVIPGDKEETFKQGEKVVLTTLDNGIFTAEKVDLDLI